MTLRPIRREVLDINGGDGPDVVRYEMSGGQFNGNEGADAVLIDAVMTGGTFNGGGGNDDIFNMNGGTFAGGPRDDTVSLFEGGTCWSVSGCD